MRKYLVILSLLVGIFIFYSCSKKKGCTDPASLNYDSTADEDDGSCQYSISGCTDSNCLNYNPSATVDDGSCACAGTGGNATVRVFPTHHGVAIPSILNYTDSAYVKFNTTVSPGNNFSNYDLIAVGIVGDSFVQIPGLKPGNYFITMAGFDSTIMERVTGGIPLMLTQASGTVDLVVPVTE